MKKTLWILLLAAVTFAACSRDPKAIDNTDPDAVVFSASASVSAGTGSDAGIGYVWEADTDRIGLFATAGGTGDHTNVYYSAFSSTAESKLRCPSVDNEIRWNSSTEASSFYAYYPFRTSNTDPEAIPVSIPSKLTGTAGSTSHLKKASVMYASQENVMQKDGNVNLQFKSIFGVVRLDISTNEILSRVSSVTVRSLDGEAMAFSEGTLNIKDGSMSVKPGSTSDKIELALSKTATISTTPVSVYIPVYPGHAGKEFEVSVVVKGEALTLGNVTVSSEGIAAGVLTTLSIGYNAPNPYPDAIDLSAAGTANTYLVNAAGKAYKFKATVRGNGVANSYEWERDGYKLSGSYTEADLAIEPMEAVLVWHNSPKASGGWVTASPVNIESVLLRSDGYVYFTTPDTFVPGNVLLAVLDGAGEVLWSWNIWAVEGYDYESSAKPLGSYTMMDRNLGAVRGSDVMANTDSREAAWAIGNYYQWGRKDPFPAAADYSGADISTGSRQMEWGLPTYTPIDAFKQNCSSENWGAANMMFGYDYAANSYPLATHHGEGFTIQQAVEASVRYPYKWMSNANSNDSAFPYMWMVRNEKQSDKDKTAWRYLWGNVDGANGSKSIYDPCPAGWMVADAAAMGLALGSVGFSTNQYGYYSSSYNLYFPSAGQRQAAFGGSKISGLGSKGALFMSTSSSTSYSVDTALRGNADGGQSSASVTAHNSYLSAAYQVRCVKEERRTPLPGGSLSGAKAVLIGNSITAGWNNTAEGRAFLESNDFVNKGTSGNTTYNMLFRFGYDVVKLDPACVVIAGGINDIAENEGYVSLEDIMTSIRIMAEWAYSYGSKVVIASVTPAGSFPWKEQAWNSSHDVAGSIVKLNEMLKKYADDRGFVYLDYHTALKGENNALDPDYWGSDTDGVHLNPAGYAVMQPLLKEAVDKALDVKESVPGDGQIPEFGEWEWN